MSNERNRDIEARLFREDRGPQNLRELLACISRRPAMYLGEKSLTALGRWLYGYALACRIHHVPEADRFGLDGIDLAFSEWLANNGIGYGARGPLDHLVELCGSEAAAFDRFFALLDEFEASHDDV
ncbi:MAG: hypothetical protein WBC44_22800 [Planctomycetaceae bacterium]